MTRATVMCVLLALAGCGASQAEAKAPGRTRETCPDVVQLPDCSQRVHDLEHDFDAMLSVASGEGSEDPNAAPETLDSGGSDCSAVHDLRDRMCELSASICELLNAGSAPLDPPPPCKSARHSCEHARTSGARVCP